MLKPSGGEKALRDHQWASWADEGTSNGTPQGVCRERERGRKGKGGEREREKENLDEHSGGKCRKEACSALVPE